MSNYFDWKFYTSYYQDLSIFKNFKEANNHYNTYGKNENRKINSKQIDFNWIFYTTYYDDLKNIKNLEEAFNHYNSFGIFENRLKNPKQIQFDWEFYTTYYQDLSIFKNEEDAYKHYYEYGKSEKRFINSKEVDFDWDFYSKYLNLELKNEKEALIHWNSNKHIKITSSKLLQFDWNFYTTFYEDLAIFTNEKDALSHWLSAGKNENRIFNENQMIFNWQNYKNYFPNETIESKKDGIYHWLKNGKNEDLLKFPVYLPDIYKTKTLVIYVYYERIDCQKNQTNLSFFIKYALNETIWKKMDVTYLFVLNGKQCEVGIPMYNNVHILKEENCSDWEGWFNGINHMEAVNNKKIWESYDYLCLINASAFGPVYETPNSHWLEPFYNKMVSHMAFLCSPCVSFLPRSNPSGFGPRVVPIFSLLKIDESIINLLTNTKIPAIDKFSDCQYDFIQYSNTVLGPKKDKTDAVLTGEYGISQVLCENDYRVTSLLYNFDHNNPFNWNTNNNNPPDRYNSFFGKNIPLNTIFIKNIWRWENFYASQSLLYDECMKFMNSKLQIKNLFEDINTDYFYENINIIEKSPYIPFQEKNWNSKKEYYEIYGNTEEIILFPKPAQKNNCCVIYVHHDNDNLLKDYVIQELKTLLYCGNYIIFFTTSTEIKNYNVNLFPFPVLFRKNLGIGNDWRLWHEALEYITISNLKYDWITFMNNSILFPINGINNFINTVNNMRNNNDFWGHWQTNENNWYILKCPFEFKYNLIYDVKHFILDKLLSLIDNSDFKKIEYNLANFLKDKGYKYSTVIPVNCDNTNENSFCLKIKDTFTYLNKINTNQYLNYICRYLAFKNNY